MDIVDEVDRETKARESASAHASIQLQSYLLELSLDWIVLRASENIHHIIHESHVALIDEPLGKFVHSQALHDLRNLFARLSGTTGIGRAYGIRLTDDHDLVDISFQLVDGRVLLEAVPSSGSFGENFGTVGGLISGLANISGHALLDGGARRMRALTGYDRVRLSCDGENAESSRGAFVGAPLLTGFPVMIADSETETVPLFPEAPDESSVGEALLRSPSESEREGLLSAGIRAILRLPFRTGDISGEFWCENRTPLEPSFELHAAAELFAQMFAMQLALDGATRN